MYPDSPTLIVVSVVGVDLVTVLLFSNIIRLSNSTRIRPLWKLVAVDGVVSIVSIVLFFLLFHKIVSTLTVSAGIFYILVGSFTFTIEVPGYVQLTRYDQSILNYVEQWRSDLVRLAYDFGYYDVVKSKWASGRKLEEVNLHSLVGDFIEHSGRIQNVDKGFWTLVVGEINRALDEIKGRSKHPAPMLINILSLSGLSFIIAQLLRALG